VGETEYHTLARVSDPVAREIIRAGACSWLFGDPDDKGVIPEVLRDKADDENPKDLPKDPPGQALSLDVLILAARRLSPASVQNNHLWAPNPKGGYFLAANIRGWGHLTGQGDGALGMPDTEAEHEQSLWGMAIVYALQQLADRPLSTEVKP
jgi:hypothetical protein